MSLRNRFCIFLVLVLTGCILIVGEYEYKPKSMDEVPAIMQFSFNLDEPLSVNIHQVHGKYLVRFAGKVSKAIQNNEIKLSPGKTDLVLLVLSNGTVGELPLTLDVKSGEYYSIYLHPSIAWIENRDGHRVAEAKYEVRLLIR